MCSLEAPQGAIQDILGLLAPTTHETELFDSLRTILIDFLHTRLPNIRLRVIPYGSVVTGLALPGTRCSSVSPPQMPAISDCSLSDADFTIIFEDDNGRSSWHLNMKRLEMLAPSIQQVADLGSFHFVRARVPVIKFALAGVDIDFTANSMDAEQASNFVKETIVESPAYKDAVLLFKHYLSPLGLMASNLGGMSSFVLSLIIRFCFKVGVMT